MKNVCFAEFNFDSKILFNLWVGYDREVFAEVFRAILEAL
ncbi:hypothetical protein LEP1GSC186_3750 [Leptospira noguchii serovar Autumnalis str. ZUN142]|uniref:Uncharacterized protein n=1 Tax=Leptospira noguchii serovar Autumnalis str. ZUN142 TaxID=1085540 RepID=M6UR23_9LEPT|nr:hypothetical protein LEP1GSC186_3750 [Leptospira noguchii serovar Autumnalis str. ZUN142]